MDNWSNALGTNDSPNEESDTGGRDKVCFDSEEVADLMYRRVNEG